jgi:hypothetical protein
VRPEGQRVLAASAPWLAALLNVLPGLGCGYIYQRRWRAWWVTVSLAVAWGLLAERAWAGALATPAGLLLLAAGSAGEAFLAGRKARHD